MFNRRLSTRGSAGSILVGLIVIVVLLCHTAAVSAQNCWTMAGSTGTVDEAALTLVTLTTTTAEISSAAPVGTAEIRYNVVALDGLLGGAENAKELTVRFGDNGSGAQVLVWVRRMHIDTGVITTLTLPALNSDEYPFSTVPQTQSHVFNCQGPEFDFKNHIYYIEVQLIKTAPSGRPLIRSLQICPFFADCTPETE